MARLLRLLRLTSPCLALALILGAGAPTAWADDIDEATATRTVKSLLETDPGADLRKIWALSDALAEAGRPAIKPLRSLVGEASPSRKLAMARALLELEDYTRGLDEIRKMIDAETTPLPLKVGGLDLIADYGELDEAMWLEDALDVTLEPRVKLAMAKSLWKLNKSNKGKGRDVLLAYLGSADADLRAEGALALGEIGVDQAKSVLRDLQYEPTEQGRTARLLLRLLQQQSVIERMQMEGPAPTTQPETAPVRSTWPLLDEIRAKLRRFYYDLKKVDSPKLEDAAASGFTSGLDPYTTYLSPEDNAKLLQSLDPTYGGVGAYVHTDVENGSRFTISRPIFGGPVYRAGLRTGDIIMTIDGESTEGLSTDDCVRRLKGVPGTPVTITVLRRGWTEERPFTLQRARITIPTTAYDMLPGNIGFLQILHFSTDTAEEVGKVLKKFQEQGTEGIIIDLRFNTGGYLKSAVDIASFFLDAGVPVVTERGREGVYKGETHVATGAGRGLQQVPVVVLINQGTASAAEILSGALRDYDRARLVGSMTYGKGSAQITLDLKERGGEPFTDEARRSATIRAGDRFTDLNRNGRWDPGEPFQSAPKKNNRFDDAEKFEDKNGNGRWDPGEVLADRDGNGRWTPAEKFNDLNENGQWDPGGALKLTIARYFTPKDFNPRRRVEMVDGKLKVVGGIEPDIEAKPKALDFWEIQAQRKLESGGQIREYVEELFKADREQMERLARSDRRDPASYPGFDAFYEKLDTRLEKEPVRWLVRYNTRRLLGDDLGRELVGDVVDDIALQVAMRDLFKTLGKDVTSVSDLAFLKDLEGGDHTDPAR